MEGWISLYRSIRNHWIWKDPIKFQWWVDILQEVNHAPGKVNVGNRIIDCGRGQSVKSIATWSKRWNVHESKVRRFFNSLKDDKMIETENVVKSTRLTVCNYDTYQDDRRRNDAETTTNNNDNNENKGKRERKHSFIESGLTHKDFVALVNETADIRFADPLYYYRNIGDWAKANGKKYVDWKAVARRWMRKDLKENKLIKAG